MARTNKLKNILKMLFLFVVIFTIGLLFPYTLVLGKAGLIDPSVSERISFYVDLVIGFGVAVLVLMMFNFLWKRNDKYGDNIGFFNIGEKPGFSFFKRFSALQLTLIANIFFTLAFFISSLLRPSTGLTGLRVLPQQFSALDSLSLSSMIIPVGENLMAATAIGVILLVLTIIALRLKFTSQTYSISAYAAVTLGLGLFGFIWHRSVYPNSDIAGLVVFFFWALGGFLSLATGLWTVFWSLHFNNNLFIDLQRLVVSTSMFRVYIGLFVAAQIGLYFLLYRGRLLGRKKVEEGFIE